MYGREKHRECEICFPLPHPQKKNQFASVIIKAWLQASVKIDFRFEMCIILVGMEPFSVREGSILIAIIFSRISINFFAKFQFDHNAIWFDEFFR